MHVDRVSLDFLNKEETGVINCASYLHFISIYLNVVKIRNFVVPNLTKRQQ